MNTNYLKETLSMIFLFIINIFFLLLYYTAIYLIDLFQENILWVYIFLGYIILLTILHFIKRKIKIKPLKIIDNILKLPFALILALFFTSIPFIIIQLHLVLYFSFCCAIPFFLLKLYYLFELPLINREFEIYLILTLTVINSTILQKQMRYLVHLISPARLKKSENLKKFNIEELSNYLLTEENIKFIVFIIYFILIVIMNFYTFEKLGNFQTENIDKALLQSFVTYIAFDRIIHSLKNIEFKPSEMAKKMKDSISHIFK